MDQELPKQMFKHSSTSFLNPGGAFTGQPDHFTNMLQSVSSTSVNFQNHLDLVSKEHASFKDSEKGLRCHHEKMDKP
ncbi:hypothetical protein V6N13_141096 [Hibiscus sabdariffa]